MVMMHFAALTTTTVFNVHRGSALPAARVVVIAVPSTALLVYAWLSSRRRGRRE
jgi:hypothetical protein